MPAGMISSAASKALLAKAQATLNTNQGKLQPAQTNATTATNSINSVFKAAESNIKAAIQAQEDIGNKTMGDMNAENKKATDAGEANKELYSQIETAMSDIQKIQEEVAAKAQEQQQVKQEIEELTGQQTESEAPTKSEGEDPVQQDPTEVEGDSGDSGDSEGSGDVKGKGKTPTEGGTSFTPIEIQGGNSEKNAKLQQLQEKYNQLGQDIQTSNDEIGKIRGENQERHGTVKENSATIKTSSENMKTSADQGQQKLSAEDKKITKEVNTSTKELTKLQNDQTREQNKNVKTSENLQIKGQGYEEEAQSLPNDDSNKQEIINVAGQIKDLGTKFGLENGVAQKNQTNVKTAGTNMQQIQDAAKGNKYATLSQNINDFLTSSLQNLSQYDKEIGADAGGDGNNATNPIGGNIGGAVANGLSGIMSNIDLGDSDGAKIAKMVVDTGLSAVSSFF